MKDHKLFADMDIADDGRGGASGRESRSEPPRLRCEDRSQMLMLTCELDALLPDDHPARMIVAALDRLDLSLFYDSILARGATPGRSATDSKLLPGLWLYATADGVGCGRRIERLCECHDAYRWLRGGVTINYHTLNDFRVEHEAALDALFTSLLTALVNQDLINVECVSQDGMGAGMGVKRAITMDRPWYVKPEPTFIDALELVRRLLRARRIATPPWSHVLQKLPAALREHILEPRPRVA